MCNQKDKRRERDARVHISMTVKTHFSLLLLKQDVFSLLVSESDTGSICDSGSGATHLSTKPNVSFSKFDEL